MQRLRDLLRNILCAEAAFAVLFGGLTLFYLWHALQLREGLMSDVVGPRTFPIILAIFGLLLFAAFVVQKLFEKERERPAVEQGGGLPAVPAIVTLAYVLGLLFLGYVLATVLYVTVLLRLLGHRSTVTAAIYAACLTAASYGLFRLLFEIRLPTGLLDFGV